MRGLLDPYEPWVWWLWFAITVAVWCVLDRWAHSEEFGREGDPLRNEDGDRRIPPTKTGAADRRATNNPEGSGR